MGLCTAEFSLKNKDTELLRYSISTQTIKILSVELSQLPLFPFKLRDSCDSAGLSQLITQRTSPLGRALYAKLKQHRTLPAAEPLCFAMIFNLVSLNDTFWVAEASDTRCWAEVSPYANTFSERISRMSMGDNLADEVLAAPYLCAPEMTTGGMLKKSWTRDTDGIFLRKADSYTAERDGLSQVTAEWFAAQVAEAFGIEHIPYDLAVYRHADGSQEPVCTCRLFTDEDMGFIDAKTFFLYKGVSPEKLSLDGLKSPLVQYELGQIFGAGFFEDMMVFDALILNQDRHLGNFGYLFDTNTGQLLRPAPLYDHGLAFGVGLGSIASLSPTKLASIATGAFLSFEDQVRLFAKPRHIPMLERCLSLELEPHPVVAVDMETVSCLEMLVQSRAAHILEALEAKEQEGLVQDMDEEGEGSRMTS